MKVYYGFDKLTGFRDPVVTVGSYDGVHKGHRKLLNEVIFLARERLGESVVVTFSPHPREVLESEDSIKLLTTLEEKITLLDELGIDNVVVVPFTTEFSKISSYEFVRNYLIEKVGVSLLVVGYNHHFGHNKEGNYDYLENLQQEFSFDVFMMPRQTVGADKVSSTVIREMIIGGELEKAAEFLGYNYFLLINKKEITLKRNQTDGIVSAISILKERIKLLPPDGNYPVKVYSGRGEHEGTLAITGSDFMTLTVSGLYSVSENLKIVF